MKRLFLITAVLLPMSLAQTLYSLEQPRNPFQPQIVKKKLIITLLTLDISSFRITSILSHHSALLEAYGESFLVKTGDIIGREKAHIVSIGDNYLELQLNKKRWKWTL